MADRGCLHILQPDVGPVGGLTEARPVCELTRGRDLRVVPHTSKAGLTLAATAQLAVVTPNMPFFECLPRQLAESALRRDLLMSEREVRDRQIELSDGPGLGVETNTEALERLEAAASRLTSS